VVCPDCRIVYRDGRWSWDPPSQTRALARACPACQRVRAQRPAGTLRLPRALAQADSEALLELVRLAERQEMDAYPLERVMSARADAEGLLVTTTGVYLAGVITGILERRLQRPPRIRHVGAEVAVEWEASGVERRPYEEARV
jgi:hypothetical protein